VRRYFGTSVLDYCAMQRPQHRLTQQSYTRLCMSTSISSGGLNVSESSTWDDGDGYEEYDNDNDESSTDEDDDSTALLEEYRTWTEAVEKAVKSLGKKRKSLQSELTKAEGAETTAARAQLLVSNLYLFQDTGVTTATVSDWENDGKEVELTLDSTGKYYSASDEADALFSLVRKLKRGSKIVAELLEETDATWEILSEAKLDLQSAARGGDDLDTDDIDEGRLAIVKERLIRSSRTTKFQAPIADDNIGGKNNSNGSKRGGGQNSKNRREKKPELGTPASNVRKLMSPGGCVVLVGRNRRGNEHLSMTVARGNDIWMHSRGCPGAHVIIQNRRGGPTVTDECLQFGADLAIFYSDLRNENKAEVTAAEPKHVQKPRGAPLGAVKLREEWKTFVGRPDQVPEELKEAREESGQTDEYHMLDKAKHRRRTKQVAEEDRAKRRQQQRQKKNQK
jgi:predicted ribosome quality control (RQC) complex YloA/Tae2 family protein